MMKENNSRYLFYALAFIIPFVSMAIIYAVFGVFPFGGKTNLVMDLNGQYADFFAYYHRVLTGDGSLIYSFSKEMGGNVFGLFAYYMSSPFFLLAIFFPMSAMPEGILLVTLLKIGCCGLSLAIYLKYVLKKTNLYMLIFSTAYALMTYSMHYSMCIMWLDGAIWLPVLLIGVERILDGKSFWVLLASYTLTMISNYYTAYINTFFVILYFFARYFTRDEKKNTKDFLIKAGWTVLGGVLGILISIAILYPTFLDIFNGKLSSGSYVADGFWNIDIFNIPRRLFIGQYDSITNSGNPNIFCGMLCGIMVSVFFFNPKIKIRLKIGAFILFALLIVSFFIKRIDMAWHIFQYPNWYPYRYAYVFCMLSVTVAAYGFSKLERENSRPILYGIALYAAVLVFVRIFGYGMLTNGLLATISLIYTAAYIAGLLIILYGKEKLIPYVYAALLVITCSELILNGYTTINGLNREFEFKSRGEYAKQVETVGKAVDFVRERDKGLYRMEKTFSRTDNDSMSFGYNGMTHYSSTYNSNMLAFNARMGMLQEYVLIRYMGSTILTDSLLGVKYVISEDKVNDEYSQMDKQTGYTVYENPYALPFGFTADVSALNTPAYTDSASDNQNKFAASLLGGSYVSRNTRSLSGMSVEFTAEKDGTYYWDLKNKFGGTIVLSVNGKDIPYEYDEHEKKIFCLGSYKRGDVVRAALQGAANTSSSEIFSVDTDALGKACEKKITNGSLNVTSYGNTYIEGTVTAEGNQVLFTTIPYENGWMAYVDGKKTDVVKAQDAFVAVPLDAGEHTVRLKYTEPGLAVSVTVSLVTLVGIFVMMYIIKRREKNVNERIHRSAFKI